MLSHHFDDRCQCCNSEGWDGRSFLVELLHRWGHKLGLCNLKYFFFTSSPNQTKNAESTNLNFVFSHKPSDLLKVWVDSGFEVSELVV